MFYVTVLFTFTFRVLKMGKIQVVTCQKGAEKAVQHIMLGNPVIGLACTGVRVGPKGSYLLVRCHHLPPSVCVLVMFGFTFCLQKCQEKVQTKVSKNSKIFISVQSLLLQYTKLQEFFGPLH